MLDDKKKCSCHGSKFRSQTNFRQYQQLKSRDGDAQGKRREEETREETRSRTKLKEEKVRREDPGAR